MKRKFIKVLLIAIIGVIYFITPCFAMSKSETIISYISLNDTAFYDIEILLEQNGKLYLPFKQLSEIFEVTVRTDHATNNIIFETADKKQGKVGKDFIQLDGKTISTKKNFYLRNGLMDEIKDEIFCSEEDLSVIFGSKIISDKENMSVYAGTERDLKLLKTEKGDNVVQAEAKFQAFKNVLAPEKSKKITFESIGLNNSMMSDNISQYMLDKTQKNIFFNNNTQIILKGKAFDGDWVADLSTYNYKGELFSFGGLGFKYENKYKGLNYELGRVRGFNDNDYTIGTQMFGAQISNYATKKTNYRDICGYVEKDSLVNVDVNGKEYTTLSTYDGYYSLSNIFLNEKPKSLKLREMKADGSSNIIYEKEYPKYENMPLKGKSRYSVLTGVSGYNNKLFNQNGYIYEMNTKKFVLGGEYEYGIKDNMKLNSKVVYDKVFYRPQNSIWQNIYSSDALLTSGTWKNPNSIDGVTNLNTFEYIKNDNLKYKALLGASSAKDISFSNEQKFGYTANAIAEYQKSIYKLNVGIFNTSPDFYLAGGDGSFISDRTGASIGGSASKNGGTVSGNYKKYISNINQSFDGGVIQFDEYNFGIQKNFEKIADVRFNINGRQGENNFASNKNYYYDFNISKKIKNNINVQAGKTESNYETKYDSNVEDLTDVKSLFSTIYCKMDYRLPKNLGALSLGHDIVEYNYGGDGNKYNMMKIGYTFPEIKRLTLSLGTGYKYTGSDNGFDLSANVAYRCKSGRTVNLNYQFNQNGGFIINNMYLPMSSRHSINLVLNDAFAVLPSGLKSVGYTNDNQGYVEVVAYLDKNKNGKYDKGDVGIKNVPVKFSWVNDEIYTNRSGKVVPIGTEKGIYKVKIDQDKLPATLLVEKSQSLEKLVRISSQQTTKIEFPLKSCVGNISGKLNISDDFGRNLNIKEFIVVLNDESGKEVSYSTVDDDGSFYMSGVSPGKYLLQLDNSFIESKNLEVCEGKSILSVDIPYVYKDFVDVNDLELEYKTFSI